MAHRIAVIAYDGIEPFELAIATEVFAAMRTDDGGAPYVLSTCSAERRPLRSVGGFSITADHGLDLLAMVDTVIVPGCPDVEADPPPAIVEALRAAADRQARIVGLCLGAFWLASAGLLDGRRAVTHWMYADRLAERFPQVQVDAGTLYVDEGQVLTSAGSAAGIDLCLHIVRGDHGSEMANAVARRMVVAPHRSGGQAQFIQRPMPERSVDEALSALMERILQRLGTRLTIEELAAEMHMAPRTFSRRFLAATGRSPGEWILEQRVQASLPLLETSDASIEEIARTVGFGSAGAFRHQFARLMQTSPSAYRAQFSRPAAAS